MDRCEEDEIQYMIDLKMKELRDNMEQCKRTMLSIQASIERTLELDMEDLREDLDANAVTRHAHDDLVKRVDVLSQMQAHMYAELLKLTLAARYPGASISFAAEVH